MPNPRWILVGAAAAALAVVGALGRLGSEDAPRPTGSRGAPDSGDVASYGGVADPLAPRRADARATESAPLPPAGPHGRVVVEGERGLAALDVELRVGEVLVARTRTTRDGSFTLPLPGGAPAQVRVLPDPRLHLDQPARTLSPAQVRGEAPVLLVGRSATRRPFHGVLTDARTGEPLPRFRFLCYDPIGTDDQVETDDAGRFRTAQAYGVGRIRLFLNDFEGSLGRYGWIDHQRERVDEASVVPVRAGPTYSLAFTPPEGTGTTDFLAEVRDHRGSPRWYPSLFVRSRLREGEPPWVRLHPEEVTDGPGPPWRLVLESEDGLWAGEALVESIVGRHPGVLPLRVEPRAALRGRLEDSARDPVQAPAQLTLADGRRVWGHSDAEGWLVLRGLTPGEATLSVDAPGFGPVALPLELTAGEVARPVLRLPREVTVGALEGSLRLDSGAAPPLYVVLTGPDGVERYAPVAWDEGLGRFSQEVPPGEWEVRPLLAPLGLEATPASLRVRAPAGGLAFAVHDQVPREDFLLRAVDDAGQPVAGARAWLRDAAGRRIFEGPLPAGPLLVDHPAGHGFRWSVTAPGYRVTSGESGDFAPGAGGREATARLLPGWGAVLALVDREGGGPAVGVALRLDGEPTAPSDARGHVHASRARAPTTLAVGAGWRLAEDNGFVDPGTGRFAAGSGGWSIGLYVERTGEVRSGGDRGR